MRILDKIANRFGYHKARTGTRSYDAAQTSRLTGDWLSPGTSADTELRGALPTMIARTREAERNDDYIRRYLSLVENNVLGSSGIGLQVKAMDFDGKLDRAANDAIEWAWWRWGRKESCTVTRQLTWRGVQRLVLRSARRDGGVLVRKIVGYNNPFKYSLQLIEIDCLDMDYNAALPNGNMVRMGVEYDSWQAPVAYHVFRNHPGESGLLPRAPRRRDRIPVSALLHIFMPDRIGQTLGVPAPSATLKRLKMLAGYEEAELVAAREAACKGYGIKQQMPNEYIKDTDKKGNELQDIEPGMGLRLNPGEEYFPIDPQHPTQAFPQFVKSVLRAVAGGLGVSYNSLASDLEAVNYSSLRAGLLEEREEWKAIQQWLIEDFCEPIFSDWLGMQLAFGTIVFPSGKALPVDKFAKFNSPEFKPRRWPWVDPLKDINANIIAIENGLTSRRRIIAEQGNDIEEIYQEQEDDKELETEHGLDFKADQAGTIPRQPQEDGATKTDD